MPVTMPSMFDWVTQYHVLTGLYLVNALVWLGSALTAYVGYRAFKQSVDIQWAIAFALMAGVFLAEAYVAYQWLEPMDQMIQPLREAVAFDVFYRARLAGIALAPAFLVFYLFRKRRKSY